MKNQLFPEKPIPLRFNGKVMVYDPTTVTLIKEQNDGTYKYIELDCSEPIKKHNDKIISRN